jgi:hypothetical protein
MARLVRIVLSAAIVAFAAGCGSSSTATVADTEGLYLDVNGLKYQIEMSRYLNPADVEDREYLIGLPEGTAELGPDEIWFGVWVRVENASEDETRQSATRWEIHDTQDNVYRPASVDTAINPFVYEAVDVPPKTVIPLASSAAGQGPTQGLLLLFKLKIDSLQNRPLELKFSNGGGSTEGTYDLDV